MLEGLSLMWPWNPAAVVVLVILSLLYLAGLRRLHVRHRPAASISPLRIISFFSAITVAAILLLTPIDTIARTQLFSVHMAQAVALVTICTPLILFGCPAALLQPLIALPIVRGVVRLLTRPLLASVLFNLTFLLWHAPRLYDAAMANEALYHVQMLTIFLTSLLNWWPLIGSVRELRTMSFPMQMLYAFFDGQPVDIFALVLVFSGVPIYIRYVIPPAVGLSPFADQAVGGALLLIPGLVDLGVMSPLFFRWLAQIEQRTRIADQKRQEEEWDEEEEEESEVEETRHS